MPDINNASVVNEDDKKKKTKGSVLDVIVTVVALISLIVCYFLWGCKYDLPATILAIAIVLCGSGVLYLQHKKSRKMDEIS